MSQPIRPLRHTNGKEASLQCIFLELDQPLARQVAAGNNKAALFRALAVLNDALYDQDILFWGTLSDRRKLCLTIVTFNDIKRQPLAAGFGNPPESGYIKLVEEQLSGFLSQAPLDFHILVETPDCNLLKALRMECILQHNFKSAGSYRRVGRASLIQPRPHYQKIVGGIASSDAVELKFRLSVDQCFETRDPNYAWFWAWQSMGEDLELSMERYRVAPGALTRTTQDDAIVIAEGPPKSEKVAAESDLVDVDSAVDEKDSDWVILDSYSMEIDNM